ncbi:MAG: hypothetical protein II501_05360 [Clostridia bacterium]|nr:hypothetical protein [Clostridia bacterium]
MICNTICSQIDRFGTECVLTESNGTEKYILKGIIYPIGIKNREYAQMDYTEHGSIDNSDFIFIFKAPEQKIDFENAVLWAEYDGRQKSMYYVKSYKTFYYGDEQAYFSAVISPCSQ